ncbi:MAG: type II toxin-antitoxin system VapC family toxin [Nitrososphaerota archaeon]|jgi:predicted nucleic acid-binding protein|nr:type II toxin-antitoxin system VapC family toxin [Nitrososphaerota archaeon]
MEQVVIDTNVVVKLFIKEEHSDSALKLKDSYLAGKLDITVNSLMKYEFINVLKYKRFSSVDIVLALKAIDDYGFQVEELSSEAASLTSELAVKCDISSYDASYVALASLLGCKLYTADGKLIKKVTNLKFVKHIKGFA